MKRYKHRGNSYNRILEKFKVWQHDIYESNKSTWTDEDDEDILIIESLIWWRKGELEDE